MISKILKKRSAATIGMLVMQSITSFVLVLGIHGAVMAQCNAGTGAGCASSTFSVGSYLNATDLGQKEDYLKTGNPIGSFIIQLVNFLSFTIGSLCFLAIVIGGFVLL